MPSEQYYRILTITDAPPCTRFTKSRNDIVAALVLMIHRELRLAIGVNVHGSGV